MEKTLRTDLPQQSFSDLSVILLSGLLSHVQQYLQNESKPSSPVFFIPELEPVCELSELVVESDEALLPDFLRTDDCKSLDMDDLLDAFPLFAVGVDVVLFVLFCKDDTSSCSSSSSLSASLDAT